MIRFLLIFLLVFSCSFASSEIYFLPKEAKKSRDKIISLIDNSKSSIDLAMYNLSYKKLIDSLINASKRGLKVKIYLDKAKFKKSDKINKILKENGIEYKILDRKNHLKLLMVDKKIAIFGTANWTKESFEDNYELIFLTSEKDEIEKIKTIFSSLEKNY
ncbi:phospholipase D-like domain-containing protein [Arcobacter sp.]|uniref:phospholipase D-like domain-containing protein n=1 Tax=Arcobacter sp. TaxID=1872629 RepID=UPI003D0DE3F0